MTNQLLRAYLTSQFQLNQPILHSQASKSIRAVSDGWCRSRVRAPEIKATWPVRYHSPPQTLNLNHQPRFSSFQPFPHKYQNTQFNDTFVVLLSELLLTLVFYFYLWANQFSERLVAFTICQLPQIQTNVDSLSASTPIVQYTVTPTHHLPSSFQ